MIWNAAKPHWSSRKPPSAKKPSRWPRQTEELTQQLTVLRAEKVRMEENQKQLEAEWDAARTRVTQVEDHLRMARQTLAGYARRARPL